MPRCLGWSGSVRARRMPRSLKCAPEVHTFWPLTTHSSPSRSARVARPARSEPAPGLAEQLAPHLLASQHRPQVPLLLRVGAVGDDRRPRHAHADGERVAEDARARRLLGEDRGLGRRAAAAAVLGWPGDARPPVVGEERLPPLRPRHPVELVGHTSLSHLASGGGDLGPLEPRPDLRADRDLFGGLVEVHSVRAE